MNVNVQSKNPVDGSKSALQKGGKKPSEYPALTQESGTPAGTAPSAGSVTYVDADGQRKTGSAAYDDPYWRQMRDYYESLYEAQTEANRADAEAVSEQARLAAAEQSRQLTAGYENANRQLYRDYMERQRTLPQQLAAAGYTGGLTESSRVRLGNAYEESLAENERERIGRQAALDAALAQKEYEAAAAEQSANRQALSNRNAYLAALRQQEYQQRRADAATRAQVLAENGDYSGYGALGLSQEDVDYLGAMWRRRNPRLASAQVTRPLTEPELPADNTAAAVAEYVQRKYGTDAAVEYVAEEVAARHLYSDEAETILRRLRTGA